MSQNRNVPAYQECDDHLGTAAFESRSQVACTTKPEGSRRHPMRGDGICLQNSLVIPHPALLGLIFTNRPPPPNSNYGAELLELRNEFFPRQSSVLFPT